MSWTMYGAPPPLPSTVDFGAVTYKMVEEAGWELGRLDATVRCLDVAVALPRATAVRDTFRSAQLDAVGGGLEEFLYALLPRQSRAARRETLPRGIAWAMRAIAAREFAFDAARRGPVSTVMLGRVNAMLVGQCMDVLPEHASFWRSTPSCVPAPTPAHAPLVHMSPGPNLRVMMEQLEVWNGDELDMPVVVKAAIGYLSLETTHPFAGGNGFVGRLYPGMLLTAAGVLPTQLLALAPWLERDRDTHHVLLCAAARGERWEEWVRFIARGIRDTARAQIALAQRAAAVSDALTRGLRKNAAHKIARILVGFPITNAPQLAAVLGLTENTVSQALEDLVDRKVVTIVGNDRYDRVFRCDQAMDLYTTTDPMTPPSRLIAHH